MRLFFGMILGAAITIGAAYVHDSMLPAPVASPPPAAGEQRPIVNWDVANALTRSVYVRSRELVDKVWPK
jgi:hypothetical protein